MRHDHNETSYLFDEKGELVHSGTFVSLLAIKENYIIYLPKTNETYIKLNLGNGLEWCEPEAHEIPNEVKARILLLKG